MCLTCRVPEQQRWRALESFSLCLVWLMKNCGLTDRRSKVTLRQCGYLPGYNWIHFRVEALKAEITLKAKKRFKILEAGWKFQFQSDILL
jgi:hypothetical protein